MGRLILFGNVTSFFFFLSIYIYLLIYLYLIKGIILQEFNFGTCSRNVGAFSLEM